MYRAGQKPCCTDQGCARGCPSPVWGSGDADGDWVSELQHTVEGMGSDVHLGRPTLVGVRSPLPMTCLNLPMAVSARVRFRVAQRCLLGVSVLGRAVQVVVMLCGRGRLARQSRATRRLSLG